jgi:hypothetical protein
MTPIENGPTHGAGCIVHQDQDGLLTCADPPEKGAGPDAGAHLDGGRTEPVRFLHYDGGLYREAPRMVHVDLPDKADKRRILRIVFSTPIVLMGSDVRAEFDYGADAPLRSEPCEAAGRVLACRLKAKLTGAPLRRIVLDDVIASEAGELATAWGSDSDLVTLRR